MSTVYQQLLTEGMRSGLGLYCRKKVTTRNFEFLLENLLPTRLSSHT